MPRSWGWAFAAGLAVMVVFGWCQRRGDEAERLQAVARADTLRHRSDSLEAQHVADSTAAAAQTQHLADSLATLDRALGTAQEQAHRLAAAILRDTGLVPRAQVLEALTAKDVVIAQQEAKIQTLAADTVAWRDRWLQAMREGSSWHQIALDAQTQLARANARTKPRRLGCTGGATGMVGVVGNGGLGVGVTCGWHF